LWESTILQITLQKKSGTRKITTSSLNIAEAGKENVYGRIRHGQYSPSKGKRELVADDQGFENGKYTVSCSTNASIDTVWIKSIGTELQISSEIEVVASILPDLTFTFPPVRGAVTARSRIIVKGNITIDGREYDSLNTYRSGGTFGVSSCDSIFVEGSSTIGGNDQIPVSKKEFDTYRTTVSQEFAPVSSIFSSPEEFLGLPPGSLDKYKTGVLPQPFHGVYYITDDCGPVHFGNSSGILIVHNLSNDAHLQLNTGTFKGLIITDQMDRIAGNALILGAVVTLSPGEVSTFGTGSAVIRYSPQILSNLGMYCTNIEKRLTEISWKQLTK